MLGQTRCRLAAYRRKHYLVCLPFSRCSVHKCDAVMYFNKELLQISWTVRGTELMWLESKLGCLPVLLNVLKNIVLWDI